MKSFNLSKKAQKSGFKSYNKMLEENILVPGGDVSEKNINLSIPKKDNDTTIPYEKQLEASREGEDNYTTIEKAMDDNPKIYNDRRLDQTGDIMPINLETIKHEQKKYDTYKKGTIDSETKFWDKYLNVSVGETQVNTNVSNSQLHNTRERFNTINDSTKAKYDKMVYASLKNADAMLLHIYATAEKQCRKLTTQEKKQITNINNNKARILIAQQFMSNWRNNQSVNSNQKSRYNARMSADIFVPNDDDKEAEQEMARFVLDKYLPETDDASMQTGIDSQVKINIDTIEPNDKLV